jgi:spore maturation protein SpmA/spore maturation protein SpmB
MISKVWAGLILLSCLSVIASGALFDQSVSAQWVKALFEMSEASVDIALGLIGALCFWMGLFQVAQTAGLVTGLGRLLEPLMRKLMPSVPSGHPALGSMTMNIAANVFGLDNAATPMGLKAMKDLQTLNPDKSQLSDAQLLFVVINTSSVTLLPVTILMYRVEMGSTSPADVMLPLILSTSCSTFVGVGLAAWYQRLRILTPSVCLGIFLYIMALVSLIVFGGTDNTETLSGIGNMVLLLTVAGILSVGLYKQVPVYDEFIRGAKGGFGIAIKIIPYLVAMLVAVGLLRASGILDGVLWCISKVLAMLHIGDDFVGALPTGLMKPLSGSGARALMLETMQHYGVDSIQGKIAAVMQGSTETTFYVLAVYLGVVGIQKSRYLISTCLLADAAGCIAAIVFTKLLIP